MTVFYIFTLNQFRERLPQQRSLLKALLSLSFYTAITRLVQAKTEQVKTFQSSPCLFTESLFKLTPTVLLAFNSDGRVAHARSARGKQRRRSVTVG